MLRSNHLEVSYFSTKLYISHFVTKLNLVDQYSITAMVRRFYVKNLAHIYRETPEQLIQKQYDICYSILLENF